MQATRGGVVDLEVDVAVVGAGAAGLYAALCAARDGRAVALMSAAPLAQTASYWAQGGWRRRWRRTTARSCTCATPSVRDGARCARAAAEVLVAEAPECVAELQALGVRFDADRFGRLALGLEGGHSVRRVVHAGGSATGTATAARSSRRWRRRSRGSRCWRTCVRGRCGGGRRPRESRCRGGGVLRRLRAIPSGWSCEDGRTIAARAVVLSTGGAAALWARTTNPPGSQGIGLLLAQALGARLADLEFVQFHPTAVKGVGGREGFLITEAIRGEGATLHDAQGERFVDELAPRDEVARAIWARLRGDRSGVGGSRHARIDPALFPNVVGALREAGVGPDAGAGAGGTGGALHDGRDRDRPARALLRAGAVRRRGDLVHRPARGQPAGVELAERVLRVRAPCRTERARGARSPGPHAHKESGLALRGTPRA